MRWSERESNQGLREQQEFTRREAERKAQRVKHLIREGLPASIIGERLRMRAELVTRVARDMGVTLPDRDEWEARTAC